MMTADKYLEISAPLNRCLTAKATGMSLAEFKQQAKAHGVSVRLVVNLNGVSQEVAV